MNPNENNTRRLSRGDTLTSADFIVIPETPNSPSEMLPLEEQEVGILLTGGEDYEYRRFIVDDPLTQIENEYDIQTAMGREALKIAIANVALLDRKQRDYSSSNISEFGSYGVMVRLWDKISRLKNLLRNVEKPNNESISDTWMDISNYGLIGQMLDRNLWK